MTRIALALIAALVLAPAAWAKDWTKVVIATEGAFPPYNMHAPDGTLTGFEIDYAHALCDRMKVQCEIIAQDWDGIIPGLQAGKYDAIMAAMSITPKRQKVLAFAGPYIGSPTTFAVSKDVDGGKLPLTGVTVNMGDPAKAKAELEPLRAALRGKTIGVQVSTIQSDVADTYFKDVATIRTYKTTQEADLDMQAGRLDVIIGSEVVLVKSLEDPAENADLAGPLLRGGPTGIGSGVGLRKSDPELQAMFDRAIKELKADGTTAALSKKWFKTDISL